MKTFGLNRAATRALTTAGLLVGLAVAGPALAQQGTINPEQACRDDAFRLCNDFIPDRDKVGACLRRNARALSHDCRIVISGGAGGGHVVHHYRRHHRR